MTLTRPSLITKIASLIADNIRGEITASDLRIALQDVADSTLNTQTDRVNLGLLADEVLAVLGGGLDPTKYQGTWVPATDTPTIPAAGVGNDGWWYLASSAGTATGNAAGTYASGDRVRSNASAWQRMPAPPTTIADGAVARPKLAGAVAELIPTDIPTVYAGLDELAYAIVDSQNRVAIGIRTDGSLIGKLPIVDASVTTPKLATASITLPKLAADVLAGLPIDIPDRPDYSYAIVDAANRIAFGIRPDGSLVGKFTIADGAVTRAKLASEVAELIPTDISEATGYLYAIMDTAGRIGLGIRTDGTIVGKLSLLDGSITTPKIASGAVTESRIASEFLRAFKSSMAERVVVTDDDDGWRGRTFEIPCTTEADGSLFSPFASTPTRSLRGVNSTGTTLEFRRSSGLSIRGKRYRGTWDPASGAPDTTPLPGDWWNVTASGTFSGITWANGDRLISTGTLYFEGPLWVKGIVGELFHLGEFTPASHSPSNIRDGDLWQASTSGTFSSISFAANDLLIRESGVWGKIATETVSSVANGAVYSFSVTNARQIEARRADKSSTRVGILARGLRTTKAPRSSDAIVMWGDSMVLSGGLTPAITALIAPRVFTGISYGGSQSAQILGAMQKEIRGADAYRGRLHTFFHGTNNLLDPAQLRAAAFAMADLAGARDNRVIFLSVIGQLIMQWNGSRLACDQHEQAFAGTNAISDLEKWYNVAFPGQLLNSRASLLAAASALTTPSLHFPGMTDGAVATTYGVLPLHYHFNLAAVPWTPAVLTFAGYRSDAGLPSGGSDGQYWLRTANGTIGAVIVRWAGTWTEHTWDATHMSAAGNAVLAAAFANYLTTNSL